MQPDNKQHRPECLAHQEQQRKRHEQSLAWQARWPDHCRRCGGAGGFDHPGTYWEPPDFEECECVAELRCPRCGGGLTEACVEDAKPCLICGWAWGQGEDDADPGEDEEGDCICYYFTEEERIAQGERDYARSLLGDEAHDWRHAGQQTLYTVMSEEDHSRDSAPFEDPFEAEERRVLDYGREAWERSSAAPWAGCPVCGGFGCPECD